MAYIKQTWQDQLIDGANRFRDQDGNLLVLSPDPVSITQLGTPFSAERMNHIEEGIASVYSYGSTLPASASEGDLFFLIEA